MVKKEVIQVGNMHCSNCAMKIEALEDDLPGVRSINASYQKARVIVEFDDATIPLQTIQLAIEKLGYTVVK